RDAASPPTAPWPRAYLPVQESRGTWSPNRARPAPSHWNTRAEVRSPPETPRATKSIDKVYRRRTASWEPILTRLSVVSCPHAAGPQDRHYLHSGPGLLLVGGIE